MKPDYEMIKQKLSIEKVLREYGMLQGLKKNGSRLYGRCPIHHGDNPRAFNVHLNKNLWNCFTHCGGGSVIDLIMAIEKVSVYQAVKIGYDLLGITVTDSQKLEEKFNPINFNLGLETDHHYLKQRNIDVKTAKYFEIGYCSKGIMADRIAIPIYDENEKIVAYCGRAIKDTNPKYLFPKGFHKNRVVYNLNRVRKHKGKQVVIVEGFFDVFALYQAGIDSVAIMGSSLSLNQKKQLLSLEQRLSLMFDGDDAGRKGMQKALYMLKEKWPIKVIYLPDQMQPEDLNPNYVKELI